MEASSRYAKKLSELWSDLDAFLEDLSAEGFEPQLSDSSRKILEDHWSRISRACSISYSEASETDFAYLLKKKDLKSLEKNSAWGLLLGPESFQEEAALKDCAYLSLKAPDAACDFILSRMIHKEWAAEETAALPQGVLAEPGVFVGPDCEIADGVILEAGVRIGARVKIGAHTRIGANSRIGDDVIIGSHCYFSGPVSLGGNGFGLLSYPKNPLPRQRVHAGRVLIGDGVRLGAFVAVDRGVLEDTLIGDGSQLDNFIQVAHNCQIGKVNVLCGNVALSGSTILGDFVTLGGMVISKGHLKVGSKSQIGGFSGLYSDVPEASQLRGIPARPVRKDLRLMALYEELPELFKRLRSLENKVESFS